MPAWRWQQCLCLAVLFVPTLFVHIKAEYQTSTAESRSITLEDGSRVQLAAASALTTDFANGRRNVKVLKGEAFLMSCRIATVPLSWRRKT